MTQGSWLPDSAVASSAGTRPDGVGVDADAPAVVLVTTYGKVY